ncbi:hypothetical protein BKA70DRAFT_1432114 [Coprinopsis sp. MPI-PUGE-AT-0042]|nr:hypothetical protein BKA70DRAFT_1432114 [Coprinopsis sp. MPI-PUGE-AT-0042]
MSSDNAIVVFATVLPATEALSASSSVTISLDGVSTLDETLMPLSGVIPNPPPSSPTPTPPRPAPSPSQPNGSPRSNSPSNIQRRLTDGPFPVISSPSTDDLNTPTRASSNTQAKDGSRAIVTTDSRGLVITKALPPDRIITTTDPTPGIVVLIEPADDSAGGCKGDGDGASATGMVTIMVVVLGILVAPAS